MPQNISISQETDLISLSSGKQAGVCATEVDGEAATAGKHEMF